MHMSDETYDMLKWVAQIVLPALGALYAALAVYWHFPYGDEIVGSIAAIDTFLGALLKKSSDAYSGDGELIVDTSDPLKDIYSIAIPDYPEVLAAKDKVILNVKRPEHMKSDSEA